MNEIDLFKRSYLQGHSIFIQGPKGTRKVRMAYELLSHCHVQEHEIVAITASEFTETFVSRVSDFLLQDTRVFLVTQIHLLPLHKHSAFLSALTHARRLFFACGIRVILISSRRCELDRRIQERTTTMKIRVRGCHRDNLDERVHWALELACRVTQKRVTQLSESAADFLENAGAEIQDEGLLHTLIYAVQNSSRGVLRLDDFFKSDNGKRPSPDEPATCCN